jgi:c(7)-type cytochrome triheme protein
MISMNHPNGKGVAASSEAPASRAEPMAAGVVTAVEAASLDKQVVLALPADYTFAGGGGGRVVFSHETHVDPRSPRCGTCHATVFRLHEPGRPLTGEHSGERMHEELCGSCHDGQRAFSVGENCDVCHRE